MNEDYMQNIADWLLCFATTIENGDERKNWVEGICDALEDKDVDALISKVFAVRNTTDFFIEELKRVKEND